MRIHIFFNQKHIHRKSPIKRHLREKSYRTNNFGKFSMTVRTRNKMQDQMGEITLNNLRTSKLNGYSLTNSIKKLLIYLFFY